jgi:integrase
MARIARAPKIDSRSARLKLAARREPYWRVITPGCALGYRRTEGAGRSAAGTWIARHQGTLGRKRYHALGAADDILDGDGAAALSFAQAQDKARDWFKRTARDAAGGDAPLGPYTVADAMREYLSWFARRRKSIDRTRIIVNAFINPRLGPLEVRDLTTARIRDWHEKIAASPRRLRPKRGGLPRYAEAIQDPDAKRARQATANRILTVLTASLNRAWREGKVPGDDAWRRVAPFRDVGAPVIRYLSEAECTRLVNACAPTFRRLVQTALLTGCRYGELIALRIGDFDAEAWTVAIRTSKSGKPRQVALNEDGRAFFVSITAGLPASAPMLMRDDGSAWQPAAQKRPLRAACAAAKINPPASFHILRHTYASQLAMRGVPSAVIAKQLGHSGTAMTEKHYAHLAPSYISEIIRANLPTLGNVNVGNVTSITPRPTAVK